MGNRFRGGIQKNAMPPLHRYFGNPALTRLGQLFFKSPVGDFYCGLRGFRKDAYERMALRTTGMEFATEMVVKATLLESAHCRGSDHAFSGWTQSSSPFAYVARWLAHFALFFAV